VARHAGLRVTEESAATGAKTPRFTRAFGRNVGNRTAFAGKTAAEVNPSE
jgi:hypothetical protein